MGTEGCGGEREYVEKWTNRFSCRKLYAGEAAVRWRRGRAGENRRGRGRGGWKGKEEDEGKEEEE